MFQCRQWGPEYSMVQTTKGTTRTRKWRSQITRLHMCSWVRDKPFSSQTYFQRKKKPQNLALWKKSKSSLWRMRDRGKQLTPDEEELLTGLDFNGTGELPFFRPLWRNPISRTCIFLSLWHRVYFQAVSFCITTAKWHKREIKVKGTNCVSFF